MMLDVNISAEFDSRITVLEQTVNSSSSLDAIRHSFLSFGRWISQISPNKEDNMESWIVRYCKLLEFSLVQKEVVAEFLLCFGLLLVCHHPNVSTKRKAEWSKKLSHSVIISTCSEFLLYSLVNSYLHCWAVSSSSSLNGCFEDTNQILSRLCIVVESATESSTVLGDILPLILSLQNLVSLQKQIPTTIGLRMDLLCSFFSEFTRCLSKLVHFLRQQSPNSLSYDHKRLESGICALLYASFCFFSDCISFYADALFPVSDKLVVFALQLLEICETYELSVGKKLCYQMICILFRRNMFQSSEILQLFICIQCDVLRWYKKMADHFDEDRETRMDIINDTVEEEVVHRCSRMESKYSNNIGYGSLLWALKSYRLYHQSVFYSFERNQQVIAKRNALDRWLLTFCERVEQVPTLCFLRSTLSKCKRWLKHQTRERTLLINPLVNDPSILVETPIEKKMGEAKVRGDKRSSRWKEDVKEEAETYKKPLKMVHPSAPIDISPVEDTEMSEKRNVPSEKKLALQMMSGVDITSSSTVSSTYQLFDTHQTQVESGDVHEEVMQLVDDENDIKESFYQDEPEDSQSTTASDVDAIVNDIDLEIVGEK